MAIRRKRLISIITPCYNSSRTLARTIESVLKQSYSPAEYIIVDGGSTDSTLSIVKKYESQFRGRLIWISERDAGTYDAMNKGINLAKGELIGIVNSDDWYEPSTCEIVAAAYAKNGNGIYYGILRYLANDREFQLKRDHHSNLDHGMIQHPTCFVTRNIYDQIGLFSSHYHIASDYEFMMRAKRHGVPFYPLDVVLANFSGEGASNVKDYQRLKEVLAIQLRYEVNTKKDVRIILLKKKIAMLVDQLLRRR